MNSESEPYLMGIDGGGSHLRVLITRPDLTVCAEVIGPAANPSSVGHVVATQRIQNTITAALTQASITAKSISAVGIGIAGASHHHSADWLQNTLRPMLANTQLVLSSDIEIALVGAHGQRRGILLLAGTGTVSCGVNQAGDTIQVGGWGYQLGDEGSGYWIGLQALRHTIRITDGLEPPSLLANAILDHLGMKSARELIPWLYHSDQSRVKQIAELAPIVLTDHICKATPAQHIIQQTINALIDLVSIVQKRLGEDPLPVAFAGSILTNPNPVSIGVCQRLALETIPIPKYAPVMGAILIAREKLTQTHSYSSIPNTLKD